MKLLKTIVPVKRRVWLRDQTRRIRVFPRDLRLRLLTGAWPTRGRA